MAAGLPLPLLLRRSHRARPPAAPPRPAQVVRPTAFDSFRNFVKWRGTVASLVWTVLSQAARDAWAPATGGGATADASARALLARLKGGLRRLDCRSADEYDDGEYEEAAAAVHAAAQQLAAHCASGAALGWSWRWQRLQCCCLARQRHRGAPAALLPLRPRSPPPVPCAAALAPRPGWSFPWGLRARLAELLLRGIFDTLDEGQYSGHRQELLTLLQARRLGRSACALRSLGAARPGAVPEAAAALCWCECRLWLLLCLSCWAPPLLPGPPPTRPCRARCRRAPPARPASRRAACGRRWR